jgi:uncharacterized membrane protein HdeD (DUF308 family)
MTTTENSVKKGPVMWVTLFKGVLLVVLGLWMLKMPRESFEGLAFLIGLITLIGGLIETLPEESLYIFPEISLKTEI